MRVVMFSAAPVADVVFARYDAALELACQTHRCESSDLDQESEVAGSSTGEAKHYSETVGE